MSSAKHKRQAVRKAKKGERVRQVAAIPYRLDDKGEVAVMLVTTRTTRRFTVPKGWPMKRKSGRKAALTEAWEEAGVKGTAAREPIGRYSYWKRLPAGFVLVNVTAYAVEVDEVAETWPEVKTRERAWLPVADAALLIDEPELSTLVREFVPPVTGAG